MNVQNSFEFNFPVDSLISNFNTIIQSTPRLIGLVPTGSAMVDTVTEWQDMVLSENKWTVTAVNAADNTATIFTVASTSGLAVGMVVKFESSTGQTRAGLGIISDVQSGTQFTIVRNHASTTLAVIAVNDKFRIFNPRQQGSDPIIGVNKQPTSTKNYSQIFDATIKLSKTALAVGRNGDFNNIQKQIDLALTQLAWQQEQAMLYGWALAPSEGVAGIMGGLEYYMQNGNVESTGGALSATIINNALSMIHAKAGQFNGNIALIGNVNQAQRMSAFNTSGTNPLSTRVASDTSTGTYVNRFISNIDGSQFTFITDRNMPTDQVWAVDLSAVERCYLRPMATEEVTTQSDAVIYRILMEGSMRVLNGKERFARITGLTV